MNNSMNESIRIFIIQKNSSNESINKWTSKKKWMHKGEMLTCRDKIK